MTSNKMFPLDFSNIENFGLAATIRDTQRYIFEIWAYSFEGPEINRDKCMVFSLPKIDSISLCKRCIYDKQTIEVVSVGKDKIASNCLELIHAYLCGSRQEYLYFTTMENQNGWHIKILGIGGSGEFVSKEFNMFCEEKDI